MVTQLSPLDRAAHLGSADATTQYLNQVLADGDTDGLLHALGHIANLRGMTEIANDAGLGRESLYKALSPGAKPRAETPFRVSAKLECNCTW